MGTLPTLHIIEKNLGTSTYSNRINGFKRKKTVSRVSYWAIATLQTHIYIITYRRDLKAPYLAQNIQYDSFSTTFK